MDAPEVKLEFEAGNYPLTIDGPGRRGPSTPVKTGG